MEKLQGNEHAHPVSGARHQAQIFAHAWIAMLLKGIRGGELKDQDAIPRGLAKRVYPRNQSWSEQAVGLLGYELAKLAI